MEAISLSAIISLIVFIICIIGLIWIILEIGATLVELMLYLVGFVVLLTIIFYVFDYLSFGEMIELIKVLLSQAKYWIYRILDVVFL